MAAADLRLPAVGRDLCWWHPLVSGDPETVHLAGVSVRGCTVSENNVPVAALDDHVVAWPAEGVGAGIAARRRRR